MLQSTVMYCAASFPKGWHTKCWRGSCAAACRCWQLFGCPGGPHGCLGSCWLDAGACTNAINESMPKPHASMRLGHQAQCGMCLCQCKLGASLALTALLLSRRGQAAPCACGLAQRSWRRQIPGKLPSSTPPAQAQPGYVLSMYGYRAVLWQVRRPAALWAYASWLRPVQAAS